MAWDFEFNRSMMMVTECIPAFFTAASPLDPGLFEFRQPFVRQYRFFELSRMTDRRRLEQGLPIFWKPRVCTKSAILIQRVA